MSQNPYASPDFDAPAPSTPPSALVRGPATCILVVTALWTTLFVFVIAKVAVEVTLKFTVPGKGELSPQEWGELIGSYYWTVLLLMIYAFIMYGAICMLRLRGYRRSMACAIISCIRICTGCVVLGIPFGIWAIVVLLRQDVKAAFR